MATRRGKSVIIFETASFLVTVFCTVTSSLQFKKHTKECLNFTHQGTTLIAGKQKWITRTWLS